MVKRLKLGKISGTSALKIKEGSYFRKDVQRMKKRGKFLNGLKKVIEILAAGKTPIRKTQRPHIGKAMVRLSRMSY